MLYYDLYGASLVAQTVKNLPAMQETWVQSLGWEVPLEKGMATHSSILGWRIPWTVYMAGCSPWSRKESDMTEWQTHTHTHTHTHMTFMATNNFLRQKSLKTILHYINISVCCCCCLVSKLFPFFFNSRDCSPPGSSVHGISQARILEWVAISFSSISPQP